MPAWLPCRTRPRFLTRLPVIAALILSGPALAQTDFATDWPIRYLMWHEIVNDVVVGLAAGRDVPHDIPFAFAFHAFHPDGQWMLDD